MSGAWHRWLEDEARRRAAAGAARALTPTRRLGGGWIEREGTRMLDLSSNDYLGLATRPELAEAVAAAAHDGTGAAASRLVCGDHPGLGALEQRLAAFTGCERALVLGSGYLANVGTIAALCDRDSAVVSDRLNHASIVDGARLSGALHLRYRHCDPDHLDGQLARARRDGARRLLVVTDAVFSMDGDRAPLAAITEVVERHGAALLVDEAHAGGVLGPAGRGLAHELGVADRVDLHVGTFSKALGLYGAYVAGAARWVEQLVNACRPLIYSTALPPPLVAAVATALELVAGADELRARLHEHAAYARATFAAAGLDHGASTTQIVPVIVGANASAVGLERRLRARGVLGVAIRPPTVPAGSARIRLSLSAAVAPADMERAIAAVVEEAASLEIRT